MGSGFAAGILKHDCWMGTVNIVWAGSGVLAFLVWISG
jgi:hypothetical protein